MTDDRTPLMLTSDDAAHVLARAAVLDAHHADAMTLPRLHEIADEVGIHSGSVQAALNEHAKRAADKESAVPAWIRICMSGVPDRAAAMRFYWILVAGAIASPLLLYTAHSRSRGLSLMLFCAAASLAGGWSTSAAIRWLDCHGWHRLR